MIENPKNEVLIEENKSLTLGDGNVGPEDTTEFIQISPQKIKLKLRVGQTSKIRFKVANAKKYPVDLYYLMDLSNSMSDDRDTIVSTLNFLFIPQIIPSCIILYMFGFHLNIIISFSQVKVSKDIVSTIQSITNNYQIGFGSFVDKEVMPYISLIPKKNCQQKYCQKPYSFQHQMSLSQDAELFKRRVQNAPISGNIDNPEGGFDALMQVHSNQLKQPL